jgi:hypothetical protein
VGPPSEELSNYKATFCNTGPDCIAEVPSSPLHSRGSRDLGSYPSALRRLLRKTKVRSGGRIAVSRSVQVQGRASSPGALPMEEALLGALGKTYIRLHPTWYSSRAKVCFPISMPTSLIFNTGSRLIQFRRQ